MSGHLELEHWKNLCSRLVVPHSEGTFTLEESRAHKLAQQRTQTLSAHVETPAPPVVVVVDWESLTRLVPQRHEEHTEWLQSKLFIAGEVTLR